MKQSTRCSKRSLFIQPNKENIRADFRAIRRHLPIDYRREAALAAANLLASQDLFQHSQHIASYLAYHAELDTQAFIRQIWQAEKKCYLPRLTSDKSLQFALYAENDPLDSNQYGILEPLSTVAIKPAEQLDLVVVPLVAFDVFGHRLGTGGGYYDRTFAFKQATADKKPRLIGFAYAAQQTALLPFDEWDVFLDGVVTEKEFISFEH